MPDRRSLVVAGLVLAVYAGVSLDGLRQVPRVSDDEVWIASSAHKFAREGILGSDLMKGFFGGERHTYHHMPFYSLILAAVFRCGGTSVLTMRLLPALCGLLVLLMVFALGWRLRGPGLGALAMTLMLLLRVSAGGGRTGIPLLDVARIGRYDIMVPVFGLAALLAFPSSEKARSARWLGVGGLVALSALTHAYGAFLLVGFVLLMTWGRDGRLRPRIWLVLAGFLVPVLPWLWFVGNDLEDFKGQLAVPAGRFEMLAPSFYLANVRHEAERYGAMTGPLGLALQRPGVLIVAALVPAALILLLRRRLRGEDDAALEIAVLFVAQASLFALLLQSKRPSYVIALWPFVVLLVAWVALRLWKMLARELPRVAMVAVVLWAAGDGVLGLWRRHEATAGVTPYDAFAARLREVVPRGARVLGLPRFWLGLQETDYRTWAVPFSVVRTPGTSVTLNQALEAVDPEIVLVDSDMARALEERAGVGRPYHSEFVDVEAFFTARGATLLTILRDPTYGPLKVYRLEAAPALAPPTPSPPG